MTTDDEARGGTDLANAAEERTQIKDVLERAVTDPVFGALLLEDPDAALIDYQLSEVQMLLLRSLDKEDLEKLTPENLNEHFAIDSAVYTPEDARMVQLGYETYDSDDIDD